MDHMGSPNSGQTLESDPEFFGISSKDSRAIWGFPKKGALI